MKNWLRHNRLSSLMRGLVCLAAGTTVCALALRPAQALILDTFLEDFDSRTAGATIDGVDFWTVTAGSSADAMIQTGVTPSPSSRVPGPWGRLAMDHRPWTMDKRGTWHLTPGSHSIHPIAEV